MLNFFPNQDYKKLIARGVPLLNKAMDVADIRAQIKHI